MLRLISWTCFLLTVIAEVGFIAADASGISKFKPLVVWGLHSGGYDTGHYNDYFGYQPVFIVLIVQLVLVFVLPIAGPIITAILLIGTFIGNYTWAVPYFEPISDHYRLPYTPPDILGDQVMYDAVEEWTEVDTCLYHMIDNAMCTPVVTASVTKARILDILDLFGFTSRDEFAEVVLAIGETSLSPMKMKDLKPSLKATNSSAWAKLETLLDVISAASSSAYVCLGNSRGTAFQYLLYMKLVGEKNPELARQYPSWAAAYDTVGNKLCKKPLLAQRVFLWFAVIGFVGLIIMSGIGCCYCPALDEKLTININVPGGPQSGQYGSLPNSQASQASLV